MACARALPRLARGFYVCPKSHPAPSRTCHKISVAFPPKLTLVATPMRVFFSWFFWMVRGVVVEGSLCVIVRRAFIHGAVQMEREFSTAEFWVRRDATAIRRWGDRNGRASGACPKSLELFSSAPASNLLVVSRQMNSTVGAPAGKLAIRLSRMSRSSRLLKRSMGSDRTYSGASAGFTSWNVLHAIRRSVIP